jgi:hypothetical protein
VWRDPSFEKLKAVVEACEKAADLQSKVHMEKLAQLKALLEAKARAKGLKLPDETGKEEIDGLGKK